RTDRMEGAGEPHLDGQLGVEIPVDLLARLEQFLIETGAGTLLRDSREQAGHLRLVRQFAQHRTEGLFHLGELRLVRIQIRGLLRFLLELEQQLLLLRARRIELRLLALPHEEISQQSDREEKHQTDRAQSEGQRPPAWVIRIELSELFQNVAHQRAPPVEATVSASLLGKSGFSCTMLSVNSDPPSLVPFVSRMCKEGSANHSEASRLRMYVATRVLD